MINQTENLDGFIFVGKTKIYAGTSMSADSSFCLSKFVA